MKCSLTCSQRASPPAPSSPAKPCSRRMRSAQDALRALVDAAIVEVDAVARDVLDGEPVAGFEMPLCGARAFAEQRVMPVEAVEQRQRDGACLLGNRLFASD